MATSKKIFRSTGKSRTPAQAAKPKEAAAPKPRAKAPAPRKAPEVSTRALPSHLAPIPKADKPKKPKLVRDSFTIPKAEFAVLQELKQRVAASGMAAKKSELLRAGIKALATMSDPALAAALDAVPLIKTGRPAKE